MFIKIKPVQRWIMLLLITAIGAGTLSGCIVDDRGHHDDPHWHDHDR
jgi:hypothetical protein